MSQVRRTTTGNCLSSVGSQLKGCSQGGGPSVQSWDLGFPGGWVGVDRVAVGAEPRGEARSGGALGLQGTGRGRAGEVPRGCMSEGGGDRVAVAAAAFPTRVLVLG